MKRVLKRVMTVIAASAMLVTGLPQGIGAGKAKAADNGFEYKKITYNQATTDLGNYYVPKNASGKLQVVIFMHGLGTVRSDDYKICGKLDQKRIY